MKTRRSATLLWSCVAVVGMGLLIGVGISYAQSPRSSAGSPAKRAVSDIPSRRVLAGINYQNKHLFHIRHGLHKQRVGEPATRIQIAQLGIDSPVITTSANLAGVWQVADWAVGYLQGSANPGKCTVFNAHRDCATALAAHDDIKGELFKEIGRLHPGARVIVYTKHSIFTYVVSRQQVVDPTNGSALYSPAKEVILITCKPYWVDTQRLLVIARLKGVRARHSR
jgi:LPXTG-site transpeptidase (sortase) family protein